MPRFFKRHVLIHSCLCWICAKFPLKLQVGEARALERETVESDLTFAGFAVCTNPIRYTTESS